MDPHSTSSAALQQRLDLLKSNAALRVQLVLREQLETAKHHRHRAANGNASRPEQQLQLLRDTFHSLQHLVTELVSKREVLQAVQHLEKQLVASGVLPPGGKAFTSTTGPTSEASHSELATSARLTHGKIPCSRMLMIAA